MNQQRSHQAASLHPQLWESVLRRSHGTLVMARRVRRLSTLLAEVLPRDAQILDVGAGSGEIAASVLALRSDLTIEGIDVLVRPQTQIPVRAFDGRTINELDASWDYGMLIDVLHHCDHPEELLVEVLRVARKGVIIKDHISDSAIDHITLKFMDWLGNRGHNVVLPFNYMSSRQWREIFGRRELKATIDRHNLSLYPFPASAFFDRRLHFLTVLQRNTSV